MKQKIFEHKYSIVGSERRTANPARYFAVGGLRSGLDFDDLIKRVAVRALEKLDLGGSGHDARP